MKLVQSPVRCAWLTLLLVCAITTNPAYSKTRWSSLHFIPDADQLNAGEILTGANSFVGQSASAAMNLRYTGGFTIGVTEWVNCRLTYAGGLSMGIKARILGETGTFIPSWALGVHNLFNHYEQYLFSGDSCEPLNSEFFCAFAKNLEPIKLRFHCGFQSIPMNAKESFNPYAAIEKYFGQGLYSSMEVFQRHGQLCITLFANWRILKNRLEISAGAVDVRSMLFDPSGKLAVTLAPASAQQFIKPGFLIGLHYRSTFNFGSGKAFTSVEDRFTVQENSMSRLVTQVDSLSKSLVKTTKLLSAVQCSLGLLTTSIHDDPSRMKNILYTKLMALKAIYDAEPFDPEKAKNAMREIISYRERALPYLQEFLADIKADHAVRVYSATLLGHIGLKSSSSLLLEVLAQTNDPDIKIEILIALGKMKETRAMYLMEQFSNSPNEDVALTAREVLTALSNQMGVLLPVRGQRIEGVRSGEQGDVNSQKILPASAKDATHRDILSGEVFSESEAAPDVAGNSGLRQKTENMLIGSDSVSQSILTNNALIEQPNLTQSEKRAGGQTATGSSPNQTVVDTQSSQQSNKQAATTPPPNPSIPTPLKPTVAATQQPAGKDTMNVSKSAGAHKKSADQDSEESW
ncbi:MAG: HEAT repeat domain-containing protein [Chitinivibrionales bacterium]|nr:HEAT repeat domain-containing protein [Chitinivibrionales bacterium]